MSQPLWWVAVGSVIVLWAAVALAIHRWGPGLMTRWVKCPEQNTRAKVLALYREAGFGTIQAADVKTCSLFGDAPVSCGKGCLARL